MTRASNSSWQRALSSLPMLTAVGIVAMAAFPISPRAEDQAASGRFDCLIEPSSIIELNAPVAGIVSELLVDRGDRVARGQLVARLEDRLERANLAVATQRASSTAALEMKRSRLAFEERRMSRNTRLINENIITDKEADEIKTSLEIARWELRDAEEQASLLRLQRAQAEADLSLREIRSPVEGVVIERNREPGEQAAGTHIMRIAQLDPLYVETFVPASAVARLVPGGSVSVVPEAGAARPLEGHVKVIDQVADAASGMVKVRLTVSNTAYSNLSGLRCTATFSDISATAQSEAKTAR